MKIQIAFVLGVFCFLASYAQNPVIDSLESVVETQIEDSSKVNTLINLAFEWRFIDANKTISFSIEAMLLARKLDFF